MGSQVDSAISRDERKSAFSQTVKLCPHNLLKFEYVCFVLAIGHILIYLSFTQLPTFFLESGLYIGALVSSLCFQCLGTQD